ncbi:zinc-finger-containing protein [Xanthomonas phage X1]|nr:zinc-finger-containing protein [Xanthomonas phage X1]
MATCPYCKKEATLETGETIYPHRPDLYTLYFWACMKCKAWVGCHGTSQVPMGRLANAASRKLKSKAHSFFDPIWKTGYMTRTRAYAWLQGMTGLSADDCHMGMMDDEMLRKVAKMCRQFLLETGIRNDV